MSDTGTETEAPRHPHPSSQPPPNVNVNVQAPVNDSTPPTLRDHLAITVPSAVAMCGMFLNQTITLSFVGHRLGYKKLAGIAVGLSVFNIFGMAILLGFVFAIDALAAQAFGRDRKTKELTLLLQISWCVTLFFWTIISFCFLFLFEAPLVWLVGPEIGVGATEFLRWSPPLLLVMEGCITFAKLCRSQRLAILPLIANWFMCAVSFTVNYYFLPEGSSITVAVRNLTIAQGAAFCLYFPLTRYHPESIIWKGKFPDFKMALFGSSEPNEEGVVAHEVLTEVSPSSLKLNSRVKDYLRIGFACQIGLCAEWWVLEVLQVLVSFLGTAEVASLSIALNFLFLLENFAFGLATGGSTTVGNALGAGNPDLAKGYMRMTLKISFCVALPLAALIFFGGERIFRMYTNDPEVLNVLLPQLGVVTLWQLGYFAQGCMVGLFRGAGVPKQSSKVYLACLWGVGMPAALFFAFDLGLGFQGILLAEALALWILVPWLYRMMSRWDWEAFAAKASKARGSKSQCAAAGEGEIEDERMNQELALELDSARE